MAGDELTVKVEHLGEMLRDVKAFDAKLATYVRREIRNSAKTAVVDVQATVRSGPGRTGGGKLRESIARGVRVQISTGKRTNGVRIVSTGAGLSADHKPMVKAYNKATFRHPVFGRNTWADQPGRAYFGNVIARRSEDVRRGILRALDMASQALAHRY